MLQCMHSRVEVGGESRGEERGSSLILCHGKTSRCCFRQRATTSATRTAGTAKKLRSNYVNGTESKGTFISFTRMSLVIQTLMLWQDHMAGLHRSFKVKHWCEVDHRELQNDWTQATPLHECEVLTLI